MGISDEEAARRRAALRLNPVRLRLANELLRQAEDIYRCDDYDLPAYVDADDRGALLHDFSVWNGDPERAHDRIWQSERSTPGARAILAYLTAALLDFAARRITTSA